MKQKLLSLGLSLALVLGLAAGCAPKAGPEESPAPETSSPVAETPPAETVAPYQTIRLGLLNGPTAWERPNCSPTATRPSPRRRRVPMTPRRGPSSTMS